MHLILSQNKYSDCFEIQPNKEISDEINAGDLAANKNFLSHGAISFHSLSSSSFFLSFFLIQNFMYRPVVLFSINAFLNQLEDQTILHFSLSLPISSFFFSQRTEPLVDKDGNWVLLCASKHASSP